MVLHVGCTIAFSVQMILLTRALMYPEHTVSRIFRKNLTIQEFPVVFKICIKPGFDKEALKETGYENVFSYFWGISQYNKSLLGWAGHTAEGGVFSNVTGKLSRETALPLTSDMEKKTVSVLAHSFLLP